MESAIATSGIMGILYLIELGLLLAAAIWFCQ